MTKDDKDTQAALKKLAAETPEQRAKRAKAYRDANPDAGKIITAEVSMAAAQEATTPGPRRRGGSSESMTTSLI